MNTTISYNDLPPAEREVADLYVIGKTKKEIAMKRGRSVFTIDNQIRRLFEKTDVHKDTEFASWYYITRYDLKRLMITIFFLIITSLSIFEVNPLYIRVRTRTETRRKEL